MKKLYAIKTSDGLVKIGISANPAQRLEQLTTCQPYTAAVFYESPEPIEHARGLERVVHRYLRHWHVSGEWFRVADENLLFAIEQAADAIDRGAYTRDGERLPQDPLKLRESIWRLRNDKSDSPVPESGPDRDDLMWLLGYMSARLDVEGAPEFVPPDAALADGNADGQN